MPKSSVCRRRSPPRRLSFLAVSVLSLLSLSRRLSSLDRQRPPSPDVVFLWLLSLACQSPPSPAVFVAPALVPCPSASTLTCRRHRRRRHQRRRTATIWALPGDDLSPRRPAAALALVVPSTSVLRTWRPLPVSVTISLVVDISVRWLQYLVSKMEFTVLNSSKGFWRSLPEISLFSQLFSWSSGLEISKGGLSNTYKKCIRRADFALLMLTLSISKAPSFLLYLYLRYLHINYPITYVYLRFLTTLLRFFDYFT